MTAPANRIPAIDVLRGCAVMGILWMNITAFALPSAAYMDPAAAGSPGIGDIAFWLTSLVLVDGKMRGLFSLLFGASMLLLIDKAEMAGRDGQRAQLVRAAWLFGFGFVHYLFWWGDILMTYAVVGTVALPFVGRQPLSLVKWAFLAFLIHFLLVGGFITTLLAWQNAAAAPDASAQMAAGYRSFIATISDPASPAIVAETALYRSGFLAIAGHHLGDFPGEWLRTFLFTAFDTLGFMLLGMAMLKGGFLTGRWDIEQYRRTARHCFLIGTPPMIALGVWVILSDFAALPAFGTFLAWSFPFRLPLTVGWAALILWLFARHRDHPIFTRIGAAGRLAFSNYLGTTLVMTGIFYGWGLGLFGHVRPALLPLFVVAGWAVMLLWSPWWSARFGQGPVERLWRALARTGAA